MRGFRRNFSNRIIGHLGVLSLSVNQLAKRVGISQGFLSRVLKGERNIGSDETILKIAKELNINPPEQLLVELGRLPENNRKLYELAMIAVKLEPLQIEELIERAEDMDARNGAKGILNRE